MYERLIPDPRDELMGNEWDVMEEHPMGHPSGVGFEILCYDFQHVFYQAR